MKNLFLGAAFMLIGSVFYQFYVEKKEAKRTTLESSQLIEEQITNTGKLIVTEGHFSDVVTYKDAKKYYLNVLTANKKALVIVNAEATVAYDLSKIVYDIDSQKQILTVVQVPEPELKIYPELKYYDVQQDYLNPFGAEDYNKIKTSVKRRLTRQIKKSKLYTNAENRLISELQKLFILTKSLGWTLQYNQMIISAQDDFKLVS